MWEMQICGRGKTGQRVISPLHGPDRGNVKQGKTWGKQGGERQLRKNKGYIRSCDDSRSRHSNCRAMQEERYTSGVHLAKGYQSLMPYTDGNELSKPRDGMRGRNAALRIIAEKGKSSSGVSAKGEKNGSAKKAPRYERAAFYRLWPAPTRTVRGSTSSEWWPCCADMFRLKGELDAGLAKKDGGAMEGEEEDCAAAR